MYTHVYLNCYKKKKVKQNFWNKKYTKFWNGIQPKLTRKKENYVNKKGIWSHRKKSKENYFVKKKCLETKLY